ncbi:hypothetical protein PanWU01x14_186810 [Parasponia andersonii]|uniref:Myb-like protein X n=1 Tax=Parasponia andersonii TaxID=3476 RepID=A0A2P5C3H6_PARAD|nr:hypothetical protein PanWU01x14_186810 [Parasponia andersonii]
MSRCFPFPPPGYERKATNDHENLLEKEKHREKKHKKDKKDREKRVGKEKREKDRSDGKHLEKKDKKEKHKDRDKKKDKEKDGEKTKDKTKASDEKRFSGQTQSHGGEKLFQKEVKDKDSSIDKKFFSQVGGYKTEKRSQNSNLDDESKLVQEFARRIKDEAAGTGNQFDRFSVADQKKDEGMVRLVARGTSTLPGGMEKDRRAEDKATDGQGTRDGTRPGGNARVQNVTGMVQAKFEALPRLLDKNVDRKMDANEKTKDRESDNKRGVKRKEKDREKKSHGKDKDRDREKQKEDKQKRREDRQKKKEEKQKRREDKEKKKEEKAKEKIQLKKEEVDKLRVSNKNNLIDNHAIKTSQLPNDSNNSVPTGGTPKKRKDFETNGVTHAHDGMPSKLPRPAPSSRPSTENGRILEPCQTSVLDVSDRKGASNNLKMDHKDISDRKGASTYLKMEVHRDISRKGATNNLKMDNKDHKVNGVIEAQPLSVSPMKLKSAKAVADPIAEASVRSSHPEVQSLSVSPMKRKSAKAVADPVAEASVRSPHPEAQPLSVSPMKLKSETAVTDPIAETSTRPPHPEARTLSDSLMKKPKTATAAADPFAEALARPPHPDSKYLSQIYAVPTMEEWSEYNDDEWLFGSNTSEPKKAKVEPSAVEETPQVWSEGRQIESADIFALPYVIPY